MTDWPECKVNLTELREQWADWVEESIGMLERKVDALSRPTPAATDDEVTDAMARAGLEAYSGCPGKAIEDKYLKDMKAAYRAMRAARVPAPTSAVVGPNEIRAYYAKQGYHDVDEFYKEETPTPEPSEELRLLRARYERLAAVARDATPPNGTQAYRSMALSIDTNFHPAWPSEVGRLRRLADALDALHPDDTEEAK